MNCSLLNEFNIPFKENELLKNYTTFKVGGPCNVMVFPKTEEQLKRAVEFSNGNFIMLGNGSNLLVSEDGFHGVVINSSKLNKIKLTGCILEAECGVKVQEIIKVISENCFGGLEFAVGIPATIGGLVNMNGGCYNKSVGDLVCFVKAVSGVYNNASCEFGYRTSRFLNDAIYSVGLKLKVSEKDVIDKKTEHFSSLRKNKQPKGNSCGSVFMNDGYFAGKVIDQAGLKGYKIGGAYVSKEHANFIINDGGTATDIFNLISFVKETVLSRCGVELHEEVKYIGKF